MVLPVYKMFIIDSCFGCANNYPVLKPVLKHSCKRYTMSSSNTASSHAPPDVRQSRTNIFFPRIADPLGAVVRPGGRNFIPDQALFETVAIQKQAGKEKYQQSVVRERVALKFLSTRLMHLCFSRWTSAVRNRKANSKSNRSDVVNALSSVVLNRPRGDAELLVRVLGAWHGVTSLRMAARKTNELEATWRGFGSTLARVFVSWRTAASVARAERSDSMILRQDARSRRFVISTRYRYLWFFRLWQNDMRQLRIRRNWVCGALLGVRGKRLLRRCLDGWHRRIWCSKEFDRRSEHADRRERQPSISGQSWQHRFVIEQVWTRLRSPEHDVRNCFRAWTMWARTRPSQKIFRVLRKVVVRRLRRAFAIVRRYGHWHRIAVVRQDVIGLRNNDLIVSEKEVNRADSLVRSAHVKNQEIKMQSRELTIRQRYLADQLIRAKDEYSDQKKERQSAKLRLEKANELLAQVERRLEGFAQADLTRKSVDSAAYKLRDTLGLDHPEPVRVDSKLEDVSEEEGGGEDDDNELPVECDPTLSSRDAPQNDSVSLGPTPESSLGSIYDASFDPHAIFRTSMVSARGPQDKAETNYSKYDFAHTSKSAGDGLVTEIVDVPSNSSSRRDSAAAFARDTVGALDPRPPLDKRQEPRVDKTRQRQELTSSARQAAPSANGFVVPQHSYASSQPSREQSPYRYSPEPQGYQPQPYQPRYRFASAARSPLIPASFPATHAAGAHPATGPAGSREQDGASSEEYSEDFDSSSSPSTIHLHFY